MNRPLRMGMVGGGRDAFIGGVHRTAAGLDRAAVLVAACLSSTPEKARASGADLGLDPRRTYATWRAMLDAERALPAGERVEFVTIVTPNDQHFPIAQAFVEAGFHVVCDKPLVHTTAQARSLIDAVRVRGTLFAVTYNYSGYPMVKQAREMVRSGEIGTVRKVVVEYNQGWLATPLEGTGHKQAGWRTDPARTGLSGALADIGSHAEQLLSYVTGLEVHSLCADLTSFVPGRRVDDNADVLLRLARLGEAEASARGVLTASQIAVGHENDLRLRVFGSTGSLDWRQEDPGALVVRPEGGAERVYRRGNAYLSPAAAKATRLPPGHLEAFFEAFANVYGAFARGVHAGGGGLDAPAAFDFPGVVDGARGVHFIERVVASAAAGSAWVGARFVP